MTNDDYVIDENGAWGSPSAALDWYRAALKAERERAEYGWINVRILEKAYQEERSKREAVEKGNTE